MRKAIPELFKDLLHAEVKKRKDSARMLENAADTRYTGVKEDMAEKMLAFVDSPPFEMEAERNSCLFIETLSALERIIAKLQFSANKGQSA